MGTFSEGASKHGACSHSGDCLKGRAERGAHTVVKGERMVASQAQESEGIALTAADHSFTVTEWSERIPLDPPPERIRQRGGFPWHMSFSPYYLRAAPRTVPALLSK